MCKQTPRLWFCEAPEGKGNTRQKSRAGSLYGHFLVTICDEIVSIYAILGDCCTHTFPAFPNCQKGD